MIKVNYGLIFLALYSTASFSSIGINSMIEVAEEGEAHFSISNAEEYRQYITVGISSVKTLDGELVMTPYNRENIESWSLTSRPARTVIGKGATKEFKFIYKALPNESVEQDKVYQATFIPTPYFPDGEPKTHSLQVAIGFAAYIIVPAEQDQPMDYELSYKDGSVQFNNYGNSYIHAFFDACPDSKKGVERAKCTKVARAISGRKLNIELSEDMKASSNIKVELTTHNLAYKKSLVLKNGQVLREGGSL